MQNKKSNKSGISVSRLIAISTIFCVICALFVLRLLYLQIDKEKFDETAFSKNYKTGILSAQRGEVYDRNGNKLISNKLVYNVIINRTTLETGGSFEVLSNLIDILEGSEYEIPDKCPLTDVAPYELDPDYIFDNETSSKLDKFLKLNNLDKKDISGKAFYDYLFKKYDIDMEYKDSYKGRKIVGIRYDMEVNDFSSANPYTLFYNVDEVLLAKISEHGHKLHGIEIEKNYIRSYDMNTRLCHVLGRVGPIYAEEAQEYIKEKGYAYDSVIGKEGIEKICEEFLRGTDGAIQYEIDENNDIVGYKITEEPKTGYCVNLTVDSELQKIVEDSLSQQIKLAKEYSYLEGGNKTGEDCNAGAAVVLDVNSAEILAIASAPGYNLNTFSEDYSKLLSDDARPLINRATQGIYPPGSTFKILTSAAALDAGLITANTYIEDKGEYRKYAPSYMPRCWIYLRNGGTHGYVNVVEALKVSCNYFFYSVADKLGVDALVQYATDFGLGVKTGVELYESEGVLASPEYRESKGYVWNPGDTLQMAIGQSDNAFTPIQLASYMSTIVNGGNRYKATIIKSVVEYKTGNIIYENTAEILNTTDLSDETVNIIKTAMRSVVDEAGGTAKGVFANKSYAKDIGGKTGTAQVSEGSDTVLFLGFAPYDNPQIAVAVVVENGYKSSRAASVAADVFDYYFEKVENIAE